MIGGQNDPGRIYQRHLNRLLEQERSEGKERKGKERKGKES